ncbi:MAG TPA: coproporphyrinogen dehydrogenase HemZ [Limnochordia bacterium]|nr:coproporphyrinogen dehydrogenase HemZ [Limnochordia bacterium]
MPIPQQLQPKCFQIEAPPQFAATVKGAVTSLFRTVDFTSGPVLAVAVKDTEAGIEATVRLERHQPWHHFDGEITSPCYDQKDRENRIKERIRLGVKTVLCKAYGIPFSPWGILVGVRPAKLVHRLIDRGFSREKITAILTDVYAVSQSRQELLLDVVDKQRRFFLPDVNNPVSVYVGIPFCPTRCGYCSFAAYPLETHSHLVRGFIKALHHEIEAVGELLRKHRIKVQTVYLGGGTPTTITGTDLSTLLELLNKHFQADQCEEYTVEAGRPETLTRETLVILKTHGVQRISINPQTMRDRTLQLIGRGHTADQIREAFARAAEYQFRHINADLIMGLPGEDEADFAYSLEEIIKLNPDHITVHSLALKRASSFRQNLERLELEQKRGEAMARYAQERLGKTGMQPYYLYRQRYIFGDLENTGYAKPGAESIYNVQMMEERQTIVGLGGGAITKLVSPDLSVVRHANPKCPATYGQQISAIIAAKKYQIERHLSV